MSDGNGPVRFCRSRNHGRRCTRPLDHPGLHRHRAIMWSDATADRVLAEHDTSDPGESDAEAAHRQEWLNANGW